VANANLPACESPPTLLIQKRIESLCEVPATFLNAHPDIYLQFGTHHVAVEPGWHFGSRYPGHPARDTVYDFLPDPLLETVTNLEEFIGVLSFDKWIANADARQSIFVRMHASVGQPPRSGFRTLMMDHGYIFEGPHWTFTDSPLQGLYFRPLVYESVRSWDDFQPWLEQVIHFPEEVLDEAYKQIPPQWLADDGNKLESMLMQLLVRRKHVPDLIRNAKSCRIDPFPNWK